MASGSESDLLIGGKNNSRCYSGSSSKSRTYEDGSNNRENVRFFLMLLKMNLHYIYNSSNVF